MKFIHLSAFFLLFCLSSCIPAPAPILPAAKAGDILYQEDFADNTTGWHRIANDNGIMDYDGGGYRIFVRQPELNIWSTARKNFGDVRIEVDATRLNGPAENRMGLLCRYQGGNYYFFMISNDGFYGIGKYIGGLTLLLGQSEMQSSTAIKSDSVNHLRADCVGNTLTFYVNFTQVASVADADLPTGDVGVLAGSFAEPGVDVKFEHFVVIQP